MIPVGCRLGSEILFPLVGSPEQGSGALKLELGSRDDDSLSEWQWKSGIVSHKKLWSWRQFGIGVVGGRAILKLKIDKQCVMVNLHLDVGAELSLSPGTRHQPKVLLLPLLCHVLLPNFMGY